MCMCSSRAIKMMLGRNIFPTLQKSRFLLCKFSCWSPLQAGQAPAVTDSRSPFTSDGFKNIEVMNVGRVRVIGINRPRHRNAVNRQTARELYQVFRYFDEDDNVSVAVLYGKGGTFCSGYDLKEIASANSKGSDKEWIEGTEHTDGRKDPSKMGIEELILECGVEDDIAPMGPSRLFLSKPVIAAVSGYAVAGGLELSLMCDLRVAEEEAVFGVFCRRFGVPLIDGGTVRLPALIGLSRALDMILTGRAVSAQEALGMGLVNRVVPRGKSLDEALLLANQIAEFPQECLKVDRKSAYHATYHHVHCHHGDQQKDSNWLKEALSYEYSHGVKVLFSESVPGAQKFAQGSGRKGQF